MALIKSLSLTRDVEEVVALWCRTSIDCHDFVPAQFWQEACAEMRDRYLSQADTWVIVENGSIVGFISTVKHHLAALFVAPEYQSQGFGTALLIHVQQECDIATLAVYSANVRALRFYERHGFRVTDEGIDVATGKQEYYMEYCPDGERFNRL